MQYFSLNKNESYLFKLKLCGKIVFSNGELLLCYDLFV